MWAILASLGKAGSSVTSTPCDCRKPHFALSSSAFMASPIRLSNSAHDVATKAILCESLVENCEASYNSFDNLLPHGSSSNEGPANDKLLSLVTKPSILSAEISNSPPSIDFSSSCVILGSAVASKIDLALGVVLPKTC